MFLGHVLDQLNHCYWFRSIPARTVGIFRTGLQTGTRIPHVPPRVRFWAVLSHSGQFQPIPAEMWISASTGFGLLLILKKKKKKRKKKVKGPTTLFWTLLKIQILYSIIFFYSFNLNSHLKCSLCRCAHCSLSSLSLSRDSLCLWLFQSLGLKLQPNRYSFSTLSLSDWSFSQFINFFFLWFVLWLRT